MGAEKIRNEQRIMNIQTIEVNIECANARMFGVRYSMRPRRGQTTITPGETRGRKH